MIETINVVNREISNTLRIDEDIIKAVNKFFWKQGVKESVQSGKHTSIRIKHLGTLATSRNKVNLKIRRAIRAIRELNNPAKVFKLKTKEECLTEKYKQLRQLLERRNDIAIAYKANKDRHDTKANMGQPSADIARPGIEALLEQGD